MFGSVTYTSPSTTVQKSTLVSKVPSAQLRLQSTDRLAAISGRRSPSLFPLRPVPKRNNSTSKDSSMSEHYTNRTYDRNPSPPGTFQPTGVRGRDQTLEQRRLSQAAVRAKTRPTQECMVEERHSEIFKGNSTTMKTDAELKTRPRTADSTKRDCDSPNIEERVLHTVKSVLNRAVMEEGKIDGSNIGTILNTMTSQLKLEDNEPKVEIEIQLKRSRTRLVLDNSSHHATEKKLRSMVGIVRQEMKDSSRKLVKVNNNEPSVQRNYNTIRDQSDKIPYIDLPDPDCSKFNSILNQEEEKKRAEKLAQQNNHDKQQEISPSPKAPTRESSVGDGEMKFEDELKIQNYLESLIKTMQYQMNEKPSADVKPLSEEAHCSCMIHRSPQKSVAESSTSTVDLNENKPSETKQKAETRVNDSKATQASNKIIRSRAPNIIRSRTPNKEVSPDSHLKLLRRNKIVQPGSKVDITYRPTLSAIGGVKNVSDVSSESSEDLYLRRRVLKSPVRKNMFKP